MNLLFKVALPCLLGIAGTAVAQKLQPKEESELLEKVNSVNGNDTIRIESLSRLIDAEKSKEKREQYVVRFYDLVGNIKDPKGLGNYFDQSAIAIYLDGKFREAILKARTCVKIQRKFGDPKDYMASVSGLSNFLITEENFSEPVELCDRTLREYSSHPDCNEKNALYLWRGIAYLELKKYRNALADFNVALNYYRNNRHDYGEITAYQQITRCYIAMNELQVASEYNQKILNHRGFGALAPANKALALDQSGFIYFKRQLYSKSLSALKKASKVCPKQHDFLRNQINSNTALSLFFIGKEKEAIDKAKEVIGYGPELDDFRKRDMYYLLGLYGYKTQDYKAAKTALDTAVKVATRIDKKGLGNIQNFDVLSDSKKKLSLIALGNNNPEKSYILLEQSYQAAHERLKAVKDEQLHKEVNTFELGEKKREVRQLTREQLRNRLEIKEQQNKMLLLIGSLVVALVVAGFTYRGYCIKKRNAREQEQKRKTIERQNERLEAAFKERGVLLKEIHHRVKNNFQMVISLLQIQADEGGYSNVEAFMEEAVSRILSMSLIHQNLYQSDNLSEVDFSEYISELVTYTENAFAGEGKVVFKTAIPNVMVDLQLAVPLGLILNEMILNSLKHVKGVGGTIKISISLEQEQEGSYLLCYDDNGKKETTGNTNSFGIELIKLLVRQIEGELLPAEAKNVSYRIRFNIT